MSQKEELEQKLIEVTDELDDIVENLKYLLDNTEIEDINLTNINFKIKDLIIKRDAIKNMIDNIEIYGE